MTPKGPRTRRRGRAGAAGAAHPDAEELLDLTRLDHELGEGDLGAPASLAIALFHSIDQPVALIECDGPDTCFLAANPAYLRFLRRAESEVVGQDLTEALPDGVATEAVARVLEVGRTGRARTDEDVIDLPDGPMRLETSLVRIDPGPPPRVLVVFRDHRDEDRALAALESREDALTQLGSIVEQTGDHVGTCGIDGRFTYMNAAARTFHGIRDERDFADLHVLDIYAEWAREKFLGEVLPELSRHGQWSGEMAVVAADGRTLDVHQSIIAHHDDDGKVDYFSSIARDITERKRYERELADRTLHDPLTKLPNRALITDRLEQALARAERTATDFALLSLDVDRFKVVNDSLGHEVGDRLLQALTQRIRTVLRPSDTLARLAGDEFVVLAEDTRSGGVEVADRIQRALEAPFVVEEGEVFLTMSIGVAACTEPHRTDVENLLRDADAARYRAKQRGRGNYEVFDERMRAQVVRRIETETALRRAVDDGELRLHYQPVVSLTDGRIAGVEALVRWQHPDRGLLLPEEFIPLAEEAGLIVSLGERVLRDACALAGSWRSPRDPMLWVNLSAHHLSHGSLAETLDALLSDARLPAGRLGLEITESALMEDADETVTALGALHDRGVGLAIDDFGTGYSSLTYLKRFPVTSLKVDRSFVEGVGREPESDAIVNAQVSMGHALGISVIAEGVETADQFEHLRSLGCDYGQGYFFSPPLPADSLQELLELDPTW